MRNKILNLDSNYLSEKMVFIARVLVGLIFGLLIAYIVKTIDHTKNTDIEVWQTVSLNVLLCSAFILWACLGNLRNKTLIIWTIFIICLVAYIAYYSQIIFEHYYFDPENLFWLFPLLFIFNELVISGDKSNRIIAPYNFYFEEAWKRGVQLTLALIFCGLFWLILFLGSTLLNIIGIKWFGELIKNTYFAWAVSGIAMGFAVHLSDVKPNILENFRNLILNILSWLLIIIVIVTSIFLGSLFVTGLKPLWDTNAATASLLTGCCVLVLLINAAYKNGEDEINKILKLAVRIAPILTLSFAILAGIGLSMRISQYGLTPQRIMALIGVIIAFGFGLFYTIANFDKEFMAKIKDTNIYLAILKVIIFICILTPIADPNRLSVNSQVSFLLSGKTPIDKFDFGFLKFDSGKYGTEALNKLTKNSNKAIALKASDSIKNLDRYEDIAIVERKLKPSKIKMVKAGQKLPDSLLNTDFVRSDFDAPLCGFGDYDSICSAVLIDLNNDKTDEIIFSNNYRMQFFYFENNKWNSKNIIDHSMDEKLQKAFEAGNIGSTKPEPKWDNLKIGNEIIEIKSN